MKKNKLTYLMIHCTATPEGMAVTAQNIRDWHTKPVPTGRGWKQVGYADMIHLDGHVENLVPYNNDDFVDAWEITNGQPGTNYIARHIVYAGGTDKSGKKPKDTRTESQKITLANYVRQMIAQHPTVLIAGHNQFSPKACPSFDVPTWLRSLGIPEVNIYKPVK